RALTGAAAPAIVGVIDDGSPTGAQTLIDYGHINNSLWIFQTDPGDGHIRAKVLPSRRDLAGSTTENVQSMTDNWFVVGFSSPTFTNERPAVAVLGQGINTARVYVVARD